MEFNRVRKPPGGDTNDIFQLEERQRFQRNERVSRNFIRNDQETSQLSTPSRAVQGFERVRKPPGGDTHDIFGMESRQKSDALKLRLLEQIYEEKDETPTQQQDATPSQVATDPASPAPLSELNKENVTRPDGTIALPEDEKLMKVKLEENEEELPKKYLRHNTITGEVSEMEVPTRPKLKDCSNEIEEKKLYKPCIRVRHPPGGASNIFF